MDERTERKLREWLDQAEILDCITRYARGMDRLDRALARSAYHEGAIDITLASSAKSTISSTGPSPTTADRLAISTTLRITTSNSMVTRHTLRPISCSSAPRANPLPRSPSLEAATSTALSAAKGSGASRSGSAWSNGQRIRNRSYRQTLPISWRRLGPLRAAQWISPTSGPGSASCGDARLGAASR